MINIRISGTDIYDGNDKIAYLSDGKLYIITDGYASDAGTIDHPREIEGKIKEWMRARKLAVLPATMQRLKRGAQKSDNE